MIHRRSIDPGEVLGGRVVDHAGRRLGSVVALIHRGGGCDVLVERGHWFRRTVVRLDLDDLTRRDSVTYCHRPAQRPTLGGDGRAGGPGGDRVA